MNEQSEVKKTVPNGQAKMDKMKKRGVKNDI